MSLPRSEELEVNVNHFNELNIMFLNRFRVFEREYGYIMGEIIVDMNLMARAGRLIGGIAACLLDFVAKTCVHSTFGVTGCTKEFPLWFVQPPRLEVMFVIMAKIVAIDGDIVRTYCEIRRACPNWLSPENLLVQGHQLEQVDF